METGSAEIGAGLGQSRMDVVENVYRDKRGTSSYSVYSAGPPSGRHMYSYHIRLCWRKLGQLVHL